MSQCHSLPSVKADQPTFTMNKKFITCDKVKCAMIHRITEALEWRERYTCLQYNQNQGNARCNEQRETKFVSIQKSYFDFQFA